LTTNVINLTNLIQSAEAANVDLKKINEAIQNGQSFEDVLKGIVEELKAKTNADVSASSDKKVSNSNSNHSQDKVSDEKNSKVTSVSNSPEDVAQNKVGKTNSSTGNVPSNSNVATEKLKESLESLDSATQQITQNSQNSQNSQNNQVKETGEKISTNQTNQPKQVIIGKDSAKDVDNPNWKEIKEDIGQQPENHQTAIDKSDKNDTSKESNQGKNVLNDSVVAQAKNVAKNGNQQITDESSKSADLTGQMKRPLSQELPAVDANINKSTNPGATSNLIADAKQPINTTKSAEIVQTVKTAEDKSTENSYNNNVTQQKTSTNTMLLTDALKVLTEKPRNVETQNLNVNKGNNVSINQTNQQKQILANAKDVVIAINSDTNLEKGVVQAKSEKTNNNQNIVQNNSNVPMKTLTSTTVTPTSKATSVVTTENNNGENSKSKKNEAAVTINPTDFGALKNDDAIKQVKHTENQNAKVQSTKEVKEVTGAAVAVNESTITKAVQGYNDAKGNKDVIHTSIDQANGDAKVVLIGNMDSPNGIINVKNDYNIENVDDELVSRNNSNDVNQTLDLLTKFSRFTNESQVILLIPTLLNKVENSNSINSINSNTNGFANSKGTSEKSEKSSVNVVNVVSNVATVISNPILRVEAKINASAEKIMESLSSARNIAENAVKNGDNVTPSTTTQSIYLQQMLIRDAKTDVKAGMNASTIANGNEDNKKISNSNALIMSELVKNVKISKLEDNSSNNKSTEVFDRIADGRTKQGNYDDQKYVDSYKNLRNNTDDVSKNKLEIKSIKIEYTEKKDDSNSGNSKDTLESKPNVSNKFTERLAELSYKTNTGRESGSALSTSESAASNSPSKSDLDLAERLQNSRNLEEIYEKIKQFATSYKLEEKVQMKLYPEQLGNLDVELKKEGKQIQIVFLAENEKAKDTIEKNSHILRDRLASLDFEVKTFEVKVKEEERYYDQKQGQEEGKNQNNQNGRNSRNGKGYQESKEDNENINRKWVIEDDDER